MTGFAAAGGGAALLVCDWGSTRVRAWALDAAGSVLDRAEFPFGVNRLAPGEAALRFERNVRPRLKARGAPVLLCGAIGSNVGWRAIPYADCPAGLDDVVGGLTEAAERVWIAPGLRTSALGGCDVLRGEETKAFGWLAADPSRRMGRWLICEPGTHSKWLVVEAGRVTRFLSAFTGELYAVLSASSILRSDGRVHDLQAFDAGLAAAGEGDALLNRIYTARSRIAGGGADPATTGSYLSGLLIGAEVAATPRLLGLSGEPVLLMADEPQRGLYSRALTRRGVTVTHADAEPAALAGLIAIARARGLQ
ncbi:MAG TPA: 2-dehydro-3-deoxygalactonokinase [Caulobacteraceae bacterium]|nr:2-dehydro-3-deoxygalactonokinase [Caulobacteraceae bacterium]